MSDAARNQIRDVNRLEDRLAPAIFGQTWVNPNNLTFSVAPDGTDVAGTPSSLKSTLGATMTEAVWTNQIREAFQAWSNVAGFDIASRGDTGKPFGSDVDALQNAFWNGDIRIAARPLSGNVLAITNPPDMISPWAGEIVLNSNVRFSADGAAGTYQLYTVMLQEIGHALGVDNNPTDTTSVMYESYQGPRTALANSDVSAIRSLYGPRTNDSFEGSSGNATASTATPIAYVNNSSDTDNGDVSNGNTYIARAVLTSGETDSYRFTVPAGRTSAVINFVPVSLLRARVQVFDSKGVLVTEAAASSPGSPIFKSVSGLTTGASYTVRITAEPGQKFGAGSYRIAVGETLAVSGAMLKTIMTTIYNGDVNGVVAREDQGTVAASNNTIGTATDLGQARSTVDGRWDVNAQSRFHAANDVDIYKIQTRSNTPSVMHVATWAASLSTQSGLEPVVTVFDASGNRLNATVLRNNASTYVVQLTGIKKNTTYYVSFAAKSFGTDTKAKAYNFGIDFRSTAIQLQTVGQGTLNGTSNEVSRNLTVQRSTLFRFELTSTSQVGDLNAYSKLTIRNSAGVIVHSIDVSSGETVVDDVLLSPGDYQVQVTGLTTDGRAVSKLNYLLRFCPLTDPIGPQLMESPDSTRQGTQTAPSSAPSTLDATTVPISEEGYVWGEVWYIDPVVGAAW